MAASETQDENGYFFHVRRLLSVKNSEDLITQYDKLTGKLYEEGNASINYAAPESLARIVREHVTDDTACFLDVGAGTGLQSVKLREVGFTGVIDALEPSVGLTEEAKKQNRYRKYYHEFLKETEQLPIETGTYDHVTAAGAYVPNHISYQTIPELLRLIKTGGYVFITIRTDYLETKHFEGFPEFVDKLTKDKICVYTRVDIPVYYLNYSGFVLVFKKL